ncbi:hypothetical protein ACK8P5_16555 [Paenibacillus sp. EC2-1]|uniref:hypothetical protein n=1 Tax=Paenibacillus sp. EC2-1 TaxID=3388665 RepID=UPI003BEF12D2
MKLEELINKYPEVYKQVVAEVAQEAIQNERDRVTALIALSKSPGGSGLVNEAIRDGRTASDVALEVLKASVALAGVSHR